MVALVDNIAKRTQRARDASGGDDSPIDLMHLRSELLPLLIENINESDFFVMPRGEKAAWISKLAMQELSNKGLVLNSLQERNLITALIQAGIEYFKEKREIEFSKPAITSELDVTAPPSLEDENRAAPAETKAVFEEQAGVTPPSGKDQNRIEKAAEQIRPILLERMDVAVASKMLRGELASQITDLVSAVLKEEKIQLNTLESRNLVTILVNDMLGLGPLESLLSDEAITDILVNGPAQIYVERGGKLVLSDVVFRDNAHVMTIASRIVSNMGRRVDESSPLVDARLDDGSRVNIIIPPLAIDGPTISIRKFSEQSITLEMMARQQNLSHAMMTVLQIASRCKMNVLISGGTGSGKTTMLNAMSRMIDLGERVVTIEDAAELQLQQPHVVRLETRPPNLEGNGEISMRDLVKNSLRMRPDRIILGEVRGSEALDMLQAMNTGHEGSMGTIHANNPRESLTRLENMIAMGGFNLPAAAMRQQIASAIDIIIQISRMRDGVRRITSITEVVGMEGDIITMQELFSYKFEGEGSDGMLIGSFLSSGLRPNFSEKARYFGLDRPLIEALK